MVTPGLTLGARLPGPRFGFNQPGFQIALIILEISSYDMSIKSLKVRTPCLLVAVTTFAFIPNVFDRKRLKSACSSPYSGGSSGSADMVSNNIRITEFHCISLRVLRKTTFLQIVKYSDENGIADIESRYFKRNSIQSDMP
jgi:hypothetical protein